MDRAMRLWVGVGVLGVAVAIAGPALAQELKLIVSPPSRTFLGSCETMTARAAAAPSSVTLSARLTPPPSTIPAPGTQIRPTPQAPPVHFTVTREGSTSPELSADGAGPHPSVAWHPQSAGHFQLRALITPPAGSSHKPLNDGINGYRVPMTVGLTPHQTVPRQMVLRATVSGAPQGGTLQYAFCAKGLEPPQPAQWLPAQSADTWTVTLPAIGKYRFYVGVYHHDPVAEGEQIIDAFVR